MVEYVLSVENADEDEQNTVLVVTPNGNTVGEQLAEGETVAGSVHGLNAGARYDIVVKSGSDTVTSRSVTTATKRVTQLYSVSSKCQCAVDGTFRLRVDFIDENGFRTEFRATLTDMFGNRSACDFSDAPTEEHALAVESAGMRGDRATLRIVCTTTAPDENGSRDPREFVLFEEEVNI